jgi:hypothetical protein
MSASDFKSTIFLMIITYELPKSDFEIVKIKKLYENDDLGNVDKNNFSRGPLPAINNFVLLFFIIFGIASLSERTAFLN